MSLLALCGAKQELAIRRVPLSDAAHQAVDEVFASQEATFRRGEERPFDQNWRNEEPLAKLLGSRLGSVLRFSG